MKHLRSPVIGVVSSSVLLLAGMAQAESFTDTPQKVEARVESLSQELAEQRKILLRLESIQQQYAEQKALIEALERQVAEQRALLDELRGSARAEYLATQRGAGKTGDPPLMAQAPSQAPVPVGQAPTTDGRPPQVAPLFEQPGVLTPQGHVVLEPSMQYSYSSNNRVALVGYTIIPALVVGLVDVREVKRTTVTAALTARYGVTNRFEIEARLPYVHRADDTVSRPFANPSATDSVFAAKGSGMGDIELGARYQLNEGGVDKAFYIGTLRYKTRTGRDPFEVVSDCLQTCNSGNGGTGLPVDLPTGSGFDSLQAGLTMLYPSDPAVFFGSLTYTHNFQRDNVSRKILNGQQEYLGTISPGGVVGFNFGMGLALNEKSSFSIGYDQSMVDTTKLNGEVIPGSVRTTLATLLLGYSYRLSNKTTLNLSVGAGLTRDTPDVTLTLRLPVTF